MPSKIAPFDENGELHPDGFKNCIIAMLLKSNGPVLLTFPELEASNGRQFMYEQVPEGLRLTLVEPNEGSA